MSIDPFIEAEEVAGHSVKNACRLLEVSRAAYYQRRQDVPSAREISDAELTQKITAVHTEAKGTYGSPRVHRELAKRASNAGSAGCDVSCATPVSRAGARSGGARRPSPIRPLLRPST